MHKAYGIQDYMTKRDICLFEVYFFVAEDPVPPCAFVCMTLFRNVYVHVQKRAGDKYQCNERDKDSDYLHCPFTKWIIIMQNYIFIIILIHEVNQVYAFIKCLSWIVKL